MDFKHYRNFIEIVDAGSISAASRKLYIAQPALSNQIKNLEIAFGAKLLERNARSVSLTDPGNILYKRIKDILTLEDAAKKEIDECIKGCKGTLWLGLSPTLPDPKMSNLLLDFHELYPSINIEFFETNADQLVELLLKNIVEIIILRAPEYSYPKIKPFIIFEELMMAVFHRTNPWLATDLEYIPLSLLKDVPISTSRGFRKVIQESFEREGLIPNFLSVSTSRIASLIWAQRGTAVTIIPTSDAMNYENKEFCCRPIGPVHIHIQRLFAYLRERKISTQAKTFINFCIKQFPSNKFSD